MESFVRKQYCPELARMLGLIDFACQKRASLKKKIHLLQKWMFLWEVFKSQ